MNWVLRVNFTQRVREDIVAIQAWIGEHNERAAERVITRIVQTALMFGDFPMLGRMGEVSGTREFSVFGLPYVIVYAITSETEVDIVTVIHTRRRYPPSS